MTKGRLVGIFLAVAVLTAGYLVLTYKNTSLLDRIFCSMHNPVDECR